MTEKTYKDKHDNEWTWEETPEAIQALKEYHESAGNYQGPLYAPHPDLKNEKERTLCK